MVRFFPVGTLGFIMLSLITTPPVHYNVSCRDVVVALVPCKPFLTRTAANVTASCYDVARTLHRTMAAVSDNFQPAARRQLCRCIKNLAASARINADKVKQIPRLCKIIIFAPIDPSINCTRLRALSKLGGGGGSGGDRLKHHKKTGMWSTLKNAKVGRYSRRFVDANKKKHPRRRQSSSQVVSSN